MSAVAERAGCSRRALYLHFDSRADLLMALRPYVDEREGLAEEAARVAEAAGPVERLRALAEFIARYHSKIAPLVRAVMVASHADDDARAMTDQAMDAWREGAVTIVEELVAADLLHSRWETPDDAADYIFGMMSIDLIEMLIERRGWSTGKFARYLGDTLVVMLVAGE